MTDYLPKGWWDWIECSWTVEVRLQLSEDVERLDVNMRSYYYYFLNRINAMLQVLLWVCSVQCCVV